MRFSLREYARRQPLLAALLGSLLLHGLLLSSAWLVAPTPLQASRPLLKATLGEVRNPPDMAMATRAAPLLRSTRENPEARAEPLTKAYAATAPADHTAPLAASGEASVAPARNVATSADGVSFDALRQYRVDLAVAMKRQKEYAVVAPELGWSGRVEVLMDLSAGGPPLASLGKGSGHAALDSAAVAMVSNALRTVVLPDELRGKSMRLLLVVNFNATGE